MSVTASASERVQVIVASVAGVHRSGLRYSTRLDEIGLDSLDRICLVIDLEAAFGIEIPEADIEPLATVGDAIAYVERRVPA